MQQLAELAFAYPYIAAILTGAVVLATATTIASILLHFERERLEVLANRSYRAYRGNR